MCVCGCVGGCVGLKQRRELVAFQDLSGYSGMVNQTGAEDVIPTPLFSSLQHLLLFSFLFCLFHGVASW